MSISTLLLLLALICFVIAVVLSSRSRTIDWTNLGLAFLAAALFAIQLVY